MKTKLICALLIGGSLFTGCKKEEDDAATPAATTNTTNTNTSTVYGTFSYGGETYNLTGATWKSYTHEIDSTGRFHSIILLGENMQIINNGNDAVGTGPIIYMTIKASTANNIVGTFTNDPTWGDGGQDANTAPINSTQSLETVFYQNGNGTNDWIGGDYSNLTQSSISLTNDVYTLTVEGPAESEISGTQSSGNFTINYTGPILEVQSGL